MEPANIGTRELAKWIAFINADQLSEYELDSDDFFQLRRMSHKNIYTCIRKMTRLFNALKEFTSISSRYVRV